MIAFFLLSFFLAPPATPPGTIKVKNYYIDKTEIQNIHWLEFMNYKGQELDSVRRKILIPEGNDWYTNPVMRYEPIVLITYEQALDYCQWRSDAVSARLKKKVTYRLPTPAEWKEIATELVKTDGKKTEKELLDLKKLLATAPEFFLVSRSSREIKNRVYDLFSNVSEMTSERGMALGAPNSSLLNDYKENLTRDYSYDSPGRYLGFRCIAVME